MSDAAGGQKNQPELLGLFFRDVWSAERKDCRSGDT
jgi:hypothetical protein